jgi:predicted neuraminidase
VLLTIASSAQDALNARYTKDIGTPTDGRMRAGADPWIEEAYLPVMDPSSHAANLIALKNGDLLCFWFTGAWEGESGVGIAMSRLTPGSHHWTKPVLIDSKAGLSFQNPVPFQAPDGTLWLLHTMQVAGKGETRSNVLVLRSKDDGKSWDPPTLFFHEPGSFVRQPLVVMPDGGWLLPMYMATGAWLHNYPIVKITHNLGKSWITCHFPHAIGLVQPNVILLPDHRYLAFFRSRNATWIYRSTSNDGCHWTAPHPTSLPNNDASIQATLLRDNHIVMAFNNSPPIKLNGELRPGPRKPLTLAISADGGITWPWMRNIEDGRPSTTLPPVEDQPGLEAYSYPGVIQDPDGRIDVAFTYRRETIKFMRLPESWILHGDAANLR